MRPMRRTMPPPFPRLPKPVDFLQQIRRESVAQPQFSEQCLVSGEEELDIFIRGAMRKLRAQKIPAGHTKRLRKSLRATLLDDQATIPQRRNRERCRLASGQPSPRTQAFVQLVRLPPLDLEHRIRSAAENVDRHSKVHNTPRSRGPYPVEGVRNLVVNFASVSFQKKAPPLGIRSAAELPPGFRSPVFGLRPLVVGN